jgi:hypothetical protein
MWAMMQKFRMVAVGVGIASALGVLLASRGR